MQSENVELSVKYEEINSTMNDIINNKNEKFINNKIKKLQLNIKDNKLKFLEREKELLNNINNLKQQIIDIQNDSKNTIKLKTEIIDVSFETVC